MLKSPKRLIALLALLLLSAACDNAERSGSSQNGDTSLNDPVYSGHQIDSYQLALSETDGMATVFYPKHHQPNANPLPIFITMPGGNARRESYGIFAKGVAQYGFVSVIPNNMSSIMTRRGFNDVHLIDAVLSEMRKEESNPDSPVFGIVDPGRLAISGHSFGGVTALTATGGLCEIPFCNKEKGFQRPPELEATISLASHAGDLDIDSSGVAVAVMSGDNDRALEEYRVGYQKLELPKSFIVIEGTAHQGMMDVVTPEGAEKRGEPYQTLPTSVAAARFARWAGLFLRAHMYEDPYAQAMIFEPGDHNGVTVETVLKSSTDPDAQEQVIAEATEGSMSDAMASALTNTSSSKEEARDAMIGAGTAALSEDSVADYLARQEEKLRGSLEGTGVNVRRAGDRIILELPGSITFTGDTADVSSGFYATLNNIALIVNEFEKTYINVDGHSDRAGSHTDNMAMSQNFADSVASYMIDQQVMSKRLIATGFGEYRPITEDKTTEGRQANRRVEIQLSPLM